MFLYPKETSMYSQIYIQQKLRKIERIKFGSVRRKGEKYLKKSKYYAI